MITMRRYQKESNAIYFKKALHKAANKRKHLIQQKVAEVKKSEKDKQFVYKQNQIALIDFN